MAQWTVEDRLDTRLEDVRAVRLKIVAGEVAIRVAEGQPRLEVEVVDGPPIRVTDELETLTISYDEWPMSGLRSLVEGFVSKAPKTSWREWGDWQQLKHWRPGRAPEVVVSLTVHADTDVEVTSVSASVAVAGLSGEVRLSTVSGDIDADRLSRDADLKTVSGGVYARSLGGDVRIKTVSGAVSLANGECTALDAKTVSGSVDLDLHASAGAVYEVTTVSGDVGIVLPRHPSLVVEATTMSGRLDGDFDLAWERGAGRRRVRERIGGGQAALTVRTLSGDLRLLKRQAAA